MARVNQSVVETVIDAETGQILHKTENKTLTYEDEPAYIKLYLQDILYLNDMPKQYAGLTSALLRRISYASDNYGMCVTLVPLVKKAICEEMGWKKVQTLDNALKKLVAGKILYRIDRGIYKFNPFLYGKGDWQTISRMRLEINYDEIRGRTFQTNLDFAEAQKIAENTDPAEAEQEMLFGA